MGQCLVFSYSLPIPKGHGLWNAHLLTDKLYLNALYNVSIEPFSQGNSVLSILVINTHSVTAKHRIKAEVLHGPKWVCYQKVTQK